MLKNLLKESYQSVEKHSGYDPRTKSGFKHIMADSDQFNYYVESLSEGLNTDDKDAFIALSESTRMNLIENSQFQLNPYETLQMPILRVFYPKLIAKELVNVVPINQPDVIMNFLKPSFTRWDSGTETSSANFPSVNKDISRGASVGVSVAASATEGTTDILAEVGLDSTKAHVEKDFRFVAAVDGTGGEVVINEVTTVDGNFAFKVETNDGVDTVSGTVDFLAGTVTWSSPAGNVTSLKYEAYASLEENLINPTVKFEVEKLRFKTIDRRITSEFSLNFAQDMKALYDIDAQAEFVNVIAQQIALDIDASIINELISVNTSRNPASHTKSFDLDPPTEYTWGRKMWYENIIPVANELSAQIYNDSLLGPATVLACNPLDAAVFESLNSFAYNGDSVEGGDVGYRTATVGSGKWKVLVSSIVPQGKVVAKYRSTERMKAVYVYAPYVPALLTPYPLGNNPSLTVMSRSAQLPLRPEGMGVLNITDSA